MKSQILFSGENEQHIASLSSAELAQRVVKIKLTICDQIAFCLVAQQPNF